MSGINIILFFLALFGFLPLTVFLFKKRRAEQILSLGKPVDAVVFYIAIGHRHNYEIVNYYFVATDGKQYKGRLTTKPGAHHVNETIEVYYLQDNPKLNTVRGAWKSTGFLIFMIVIAIAVLWMTYKLYQMVNAGDI